MIVRRFYIAILTTVLLIMVLPSQAQTDNGTIYFNTDGDLWAMDGTSSQNNFRQLTTWGYNGGPILSPDGSQIAYTSVASDYLSDVQNFLYLGTVPTNIWVMDTATESFTRVASQNLTVPTLRGVPTWSPDGTQLAWVEYTQSTPNPRLIVYDLATDSALMVAENLNLGFQDGGISLPPLQWGPQGIARMFFTFVETGEGQMIIEIVNPETYAVSRFVLYSSSNPFATDEVVPLEFVWVEHDSLHRIAILSNDGSWQLLDPITGAQFVLPDAPSLVNASGAALTPQLLIQNGGVQGIEWATLASNGVYDASGYQTNRLSQAPALSPDGTIVANNSRTGASFSLIDGRVGGGNMPDADENYQSFVQPISIVWSPMRWVTDVSVGVAIPTPSVPNNNGNLGCTTTSNIEIGDFVTVQAGAPNNMRTTPSISGDFYASLYPGDVVSTVNAPVCADGLRWWQVAGDGGFMGWTAEGSIDGDEWLIVIESSPLVNTCPLPPRLTRGATGIVLDIDGEPNVIRDAPGVTNSNAIESIPVGEIFTVLGSSLCMEDGRGWFPVSYDGVTGWTAEGEDSSYWLAPVQP